MTPLIRNCILIVEDEPLLRIDTVDMVEDEGFEAFEASNADAALLLLEKNPQINVMCTDIDMPGSMDGLALATLVRKRWQGPIRPSIPACRWTDWPLPPLSHERGKGQSVHRHAGIDGRIGPCHAREKEVA